MATDTALPSRDPALTPEPPEGAPEPPVRKAQSDDGELHARSRRRFIWAVSLGMAVVAVPYLWVLWDLWIGHVDVFRQAPLANNFYELQARSMMHGHLDVPTGSIGIEAFLHNGKQYTYFGLFPSLLRMPVLLLTNSLDGRLTAPSILLAWLLTGLFSALLLWRVRTIVRGAAPLGRAEATSYGVLMAAITGGSVVVLLAATPFVYNEDFAWSIALTVGAIFALLGVMERPSAARVAFTGLLVLAAMLNRAPTGWACVIGAVLVAAWFALGRHGADNRRWAVPMLAVGLVPFAIGCLISMAKFGSPLGFSLTHQVYTMENAHRRYYLSTTGGKGYNLRFIPSTLLAYFGPTGLRFTPVFPFITLPATPATAVGGVVLEWQYRTYSVPAAMPLLFLLSIAGVLTTLRRRPGPIGLMRIPLLAALAGCSGIIVWGYLAPRYIADLLPFLVIASFVGLVDIWRRIGGRRHNVRLALLASVIVLGVFGIAANVASASTPNDEWSLTQSLHYVQMQKSISDKTGHPLVSNVVRGSSLPPWAPADQLFVAGNCRALYISNGMNYSNAPRQQYEHAAWMTVQYGPGIVYDVPFTLQGPTDHIIGKVPILTVGSDTVWIEQAPQSQVAFGLDDARIPTVGPAWPLKPGFLYHIELDVDPYRRFLSLTALGHTLLNAQWANGPVGTVSASHPVPGGYPFTIAVHERPQDIGLCRSILAEAGGPPPVGTTRGSSNRRAAPLHP